jgi:peptide-methionine (S)-S-oxide reductase
MSTEKATFAAGCFWGVESDFRAIPGVVNATVGYTGGHTPNPSYKEVCSDRSGHAEAVLVEYDPDKVSYQRLLDVFWQIHDPTQLNRQGPDFGSQYRSAIFVHTPDQDSAARSSAQAEQARHRKLVVTEITPASQFHPAEEYHQRYFEKHGMVGCRTPGLLTH